MERMEKRIREQGERSGSYRQVNDTFKKKYKQEVWELWDAVRRPSLWIMGTEEGEHHSEGIENVLNNIIEEKNPNLEKGMPEFGGGTPTFFPRVLFRSEG